MTVDSVEVVAVLELELRSTDLEFSSEPVL
jgi:hypothetical protein